MKKKSHQPTDMRAYRRRTERNMVVAVVISFLIVGTLIIGLTYGWVSLITGFFILLPGAVAFILLWLLLKGLERASKEKDKDKET